MTFEALRAFVLAAMTLIGKPESDKFARVPPSPEIASAIASAVLDDDEGRLTGDIIGDAVLMTRYAFDESKWNWHWDGRQMVKIDCVEGDGGRSFGPWQLQTRREIGCSLGRAAAMWLHFAHGSQRRCVALPFDERLAELASGTCARGRRLTRWRAAMAREALALVQPEAIASSE
jgi:hypothetical protein